MLCPIPIARYTEYFFGLLSLSCQSVTFTLKVTDHINGEKGSSLKGLITFDPFSICLHIVQTISSPSLLEVRCLPQ